MKHRVPRAAFPLLPLPPLLLLLPALWLLRPPAASARVLHVEQAGAGRPRGVFTEVQAAIDAAADGDTIRIGEGLFTASTAASIVDPLCGNCLEHRTPVAATAGFRIAGARRLALIGAGAERTVLSTGAGYGIWIDGGGGGEVRVEHLAVTGGARDADGNATDAGVVVRGARVTLEQVHVRDNTARAADEKVVVGIAGVVGREGAVLEVAGCRIENNGWDGIALYRGATALIHDNVIEQGRGAGIGITWDAAAIVLRNRVSGYWKGIGTFGSSRAVVRNNAVFDNLGWGIIATGGSYLEATQNVIVRNGNCGFAVWDSAATGTARNNLIVDNGWRKEWVCPRVGIWHVGDPARFTVPWNAAWRNVAGDLRVEGAGEAGAGAPTGAAAAAGEGGGAAADTSVARPISIDPLFEGAADFRLRAGSPAIDAGDPDIQDADGSRSDLGLGGGSQAREHLGAPPPALPAERNRVGSAAWAATIASRRAARSPQHSP